MVTGTAKRVSMRRARAKSVRHSLAPPQPARPGEPQPIAEQEDGEEEYEEYEYEEYSDEDDDDRFWNTSAAPTPATATQVPTPKPDGMLPTRRLLAYKARRRDQVAELFMRPAYAKQYEAYFPISSRHWTDLTFACLLKAPFRPNLDHPVVRCTRPGGGTIHG